MNTQRVILISVAAAALVVVIMYYTHESHNRFVIVNAAPGVAYEMDKKTGKTWRIQGNKKTEQMDPQERIEKAIGLPESERNKITGNGGISQFSEGFFGQLYNGSGWIISSFVVVIECQNSEKKRKWLRRYRVSEEIQPLTEKSFKVAEIKRHPFNDKSDDTCTSVDWFLDELTGWKE